MGKITRIIAIILTIIMCFVLLPEYVRAEGTTQFTEMTSAEQLANALVSGTEVSIVEGSVTYSGSNAAASTFKNLNFGTVDEVTYTMSDGVLLTTGDGTPATSNTDSSYGIGHSLPGNTELESLIGISGTHDALVLEFRFTVPEGYPSVELQFMFGSEEYPQYLDSVVDGAAIIVDGTNYAKFANGTPLKVVSEAEFYNNVSGNLAIEYNGITKAMGLVAVLNQELTEHTCKIIIADTSDDSYDSGLFLATLKQSMKTSSGIGELTSSDDSSLSDIILSEGTLSPSFSKENPAETVYMATVSNSASSIKIKPIGGDSNSTMKINGNLVVNSAFSGDLLLNVGENTFTIVVTSENGKYTSTYNVKVNRNNAFSEPTVNTFNGLYDEATHEFSVVPIEEGALVQYAVDGGAFSEVKPSYSEVGNHNIQYKISKVGYDDYTGVSTLNIEEPVASTVNVSDILFTEMESDTFEGTCQNALSTASLKVIPNYPDSIIKINGIAYPAGTVNMEVDLSVGENIFIIDTCYPDGTVANTYTYKVNRNATLSEPEVQIYEGPYDGESHLFKVIPADEGCTVTYESESYPASEVPPSFTTVGTYSVNYTISKVGFDNYVGSGTIKITPSNDATLSDLRLYVNDTEHEYKREFAGNSVAFSTTVENAVDSINVLPIPNSKYASFTIDGNEVEQSTATAVSLAEGKNEIEILVTAQNGDTKTYKLHVLREAADITPVEPSSSGYYIQGTIFGGTAPYTVILKDGQTVVKQVTTDALGNYLLEEVEKGLYNILIEDSSTTSRSMLVEIEVVNQNITDENYIFPDETANSKLVLTPGTPNVIVGNLAKEAQEQAIGGSDVNIVLSIDSEEADGSSEQANIIASAGSKKLGFMEISVDLEVDTVVTHLENTNEVLEIVVPYDFTGKTNVGVYRYHGGTVQNFTKLDEKPSVFMDATYYLDSVNGYVYIYTANFSQYAIGYDLASTASTGTSGTSGSVTDLLSGNNDAELTNLSDKDKSPATGDQSIPMGIVVMVLICLITFKFVLDGYEVQSGITDLRRKESVKKWASWIKNGGKSESRLNIAVAGLSFTVISCFIKNRIFGKLKSNKVTSK